MIRKPWWSEANGWIWPGCRGYTPTLFQGHPGIFNDHRVRTLKKKATSFSRFLSFLNLLFKFIQQKVERTQKYAKKILLFLQWSYESHVYYNADTISDICLYAFYNETLFKWVVELCTQPNSSKNASKMHFHCRLERVSYSIDLKMTNVAKLDKQVYLILFQ